MPEQAALVRDLVYRLFTICERQSRAQEALAYNNLIGVWSELTRLTGSESEGETVQSSLF